MRCFALNHTDHRTHAEQDAVIGVYIRWRNHHTTPNTALGPELNNRKPDYLAKPA
ncbi:hypothetical protein [Dactylosporangium darangshiense]|uniref:Transposase n=1 Tax=Dactylosporangium darangshiense TaxID=579108 RepID=A0ABP8DTM5_9ACTN